MGSSGTVRLSAVFKMLEHCARDFTKRERVHNWVITFQEKEYPSLPKGPHGKPDPEIEKGHIKKMIKKLGIDMECAKQYLPLLR